MWRKRYGYVCVCVGGGGTINMLILTEVSDMPTTRPQTGLSGLRFWGRKV